MIFNQFNLNQSIKKFLTITSIGLFILGSTQVKAVSPLERFAPNIPNGLDVYLSPKLLEHFSRDLDKSLTVIDFNFNEFSIDSKSHRTGVMPLEEIISNQTLLKSIKSLRYQFQKFFEGISIKNKHDIEMNLNGLKANLNWKNISFRLIPHEGVKNKITVIFILSADKVELGLESLRIQDHQHSFIGQVGGDKFFVDLDEKTGPLNILVPIEVELNSLINKVSITVKNIESNISKVNLLAGWNAPLKLPKVKVTVNGRSSYLQALEVEKTLKKELPNLTKGIQEYLQTYLNEDGTKLLENKLNEVGQNGYEDYFHLPIIFNPAEETGIEDSEYSNYPDKALLGLKLTEIGFREKHLRVKFDNFVDDGKNPANYFVQPTFRAQKEIAKKYLSGNDYDIAAALNIGLINQYLKISCDRGYLRKIELGTTIVETVGCPRAYVNQNTQDIRLIVNLIQRPKFSWYEFIDRNAIASEIVVRLELGVKLFTNSNEKLGLKLTQIYPDTVFIDSQYINYATESVHEVARETIRELNDGNDGIRNLVIEEELATPDEIKGLILKFIGTEYDGNGNIVIYIKTNLTQ